MSNRARRLRRRASLGLAAMWVLVLAGLWSPPSSDPRVDLEAGGSLGVALFVLIPALVLTPYVALIALRGLRTRDRFCWEVFFAVLIAEAFAVWPLTSVLANDFRHPVVTATSRALLAYQPWLGPLLAMSLAIGLAAGICAFRGGLLERAAARESRQAFGEQHDPRH
jgi:hypothetical protein